MFSSDLASVMASVKNAGMPAPSVTPCGMWDQDGQRHIVDMSDDGGLTRLIRNWLVTEYPVRGVLDGYLIGTHLTQKGFNAHYNMYKCCGFIEYQGV